MTPVERRMLLTAALSLPVVLPLSKPHAAEGLPGLGKLVTGDPAPLPDLRFTTADGAAHTLADYAGRGVVLNLWATWCVPCVAEMAALDELARQVQDQGIAVLALSSDRGGAPAVERFYRDRGIRTLAVLLDPKSEAAHLLGARGIPTTLVIDRAGRERGRMEGAADWAAPAAIESIQRLVAAVPGKPAETTPL